MGSVCLSMTWRVVLLRKRKKRTTLANLEVQHVGGLSDRTHPHHDLTAVDPKNYSVAYLPVLPMGG